MQPDDPHFQAIQKIAATGILKTKGEPFNWANRTWFHPENYITTDEFYQGLKTYRYPITGEPDDQLLTIGRCIEILSSLKGYDLSEELIKDWESVSSRPYQPDSPATKREISVLLDRILNPFSLQIDHHGFLITTNRGGV